MAFFGRVLFYTWMLFLTAHVYRDAPNRVRYTMCGMVGVIMACGTFIPRNDR